LKLLFSEGDYGAGVTSAQSAKKADMLFSAKENGGVGSMEAGALEETIEAAGTQTMERLFLLVQKGYRPDLDMEFSGAIWLHHPRKNFEHDLVFLYPDGCVKSAGKSDEFRFDRHEDALFKKFLQKMPPLTFWERTRPGRVQLAAWMIIGSMWMAGPLLLVLAIAVWRFAFS
jgi:hypothetical protein